jgi:hypothetical protein
MTGDINSLVTPLWIMAGLSMVEAVLLVGVGVGGYMAYSRVMTLVRDLEARQVAPIREKLDSILGDVKVVTARVADQTARVDHAVSGTANRVDETASRVRADVHDKVIQLVGVIRGIRAVIMTLLRTESRV